MYLFTSEVVAPGHPDKCADIIADSIVDALIIADPKSRVASEVFVAGKHVIIGGEVTSKANLTDADYEKIVKDALIGIGYDGKSTFTKEQCLFPEEVKVQVLLNQHGFTDSSSLIITGCAITLKQTSSAQLSKHI